MGHNQVRQCMFLVSFLLLWQNAMTKATYRRKRLLGRAISEGNPIAIMVGAWQQAARHGTGAMLESLHL